MLLKMFNSIVIYNRYRNYLQIRFAKIHIRNIEHI